MSNDKPQYVLTTMCPDKTGLIATVTDFFNHLGAAIAEVAHHTDPTTLQSFLRIVFYDDKGALPTLDALRSEFSDLADTYAMQWSLTDEQHKMRVLIAVSKHGHCLNDLLHRWRTGTLPVDIVGVISNHEDMRSLVEWHDLPYHHLPVTNETKPQQEEKILQLMGGYKADLLVLARYMQILSPDLCEKLSGRAINIHHSFLPSFKGAKPYHQAYKRGVKIIGATAHFVTSDLDEGPIIDQGVQTVDHSWSAEEFVNTGRDIEAIVLARAVRWFAERRVLLNGTRTVVFK